MIGREKRVLLRHYLEQGMNKAVIARDLGVSRRTVYHWIETGQLDRELDEERVGYGPRCLMPSKLDPYKPLIDTRLKEYPKLTAVRLFVGPDGALCFTRHLAHKPHAGMRETDAISPDAPG